jgi:predicted nucleic acid-binding protein
LLPNKEWALTDCVFFIVMGERGINEALTTDEYFQQAGLHALMRQEQK